ncbi:MAG: hypothetical protein EOP20_00820 [Hyphomicrobiales bacterium]|nr:MAG: hypothetical protein EOP20_00820 [Hyphomicrobiales bacterium]
MSDAGSVFPPRDYLDIINYDGDEVVAGYREWRPADPEPGGNREPGYRWGWANARLDHTKEQDEHGEVRRAYIQWTMRVFH